MSDWPVLLIFLAVGAAIGSFLNVCIARWPLEQSVVSPPSRCPRCGAPIAWRDNIPVLGWLRLGGRCRSCREPISVGYPAVELAVALGWLAAALAYGPSLTAVRVAVFGTIMLGIAVTDARHYVIPDGFTVSGFVFVLATSVLAALRLQQEPFVGPFDAVLGACVGAGAIRIVGWLGEVALRKEAMGMGDETLMAVAGAALGPTRSLLVIFLAAGAGAIVFVLVVYPVVRLRGRSAAEQGELALGETKPGMPLVPFGVFLAPASVLALVFGQQLVDWYLAEVMAVP